MTCVLCLLRQEGPIYLLSENNVLVTSPPAPWREVFPPFIFSPSFPPSPSLSSPSLPSFLPPFPSFHLSHSHHLSLQPSLQMHSHCTEWSLHRDFYNLIEISNFYKGVASFYYRLLESFLVVPREYHFYVFHDNCTPFYYCISC